MFEGSTRGRKLIVSVSKAETNSIARIARLQSFHRLLSILGSSLRAIQNFGHRPSQRHFSSSVWKTLPILRRRDDGRHFYRETLGNTDGTLSTATSVLMMDSVVSSRSRLSRNSVVRLLIGVTSCMATRCTLCRGEVSMSQNRSVHSARPQ